MNNKKIFFIKNKVIECKFGLRALSVLADCAYDIDNNIELLWELSTGEDISFLEDQNILQEFKEYAKSIEMIEKNDLRELYIQGLGELSIDLNTLDNMTPQEISIAYEGYLRKLELQMNLIKTTILQAFHGDTSYIELKESKCAQGSLAERADIFQQLGIKEE